MTVPNLPLERRVLWCLRRRRSDVSCVLRPTGTPIEVRVLQDREVVLTERFPEERFALGWAERYERRLRDISWEDSPASGAS